MAFFFKLHKYSCRRQMDNHRKTIKDINKQMSKQTCAKSFDECSICLERMICFSIFSKVIGLHIRRLSCGHCFHKECLDLVKETSNYCPICRKPFFDDEEMLLLKGFHDLEYVTRMKPDRVDAVLREAITNNDDELVALLIERHDPSETLHHFIANKDKRAVSILICSKCINWHKTVNGKTLMEITSEINDRVITHIVHSSNCYTLHKQITRNKSRIHNSTH
jgi:hypothetical protein